MNKQQIISAKIAKLIAEGKPREQAIAITYSMYENEHKQGGGYILGDYNLDGYANTLDNKDKFGNTTGVNNKDFQYVQGDYNLSGGVDSADKVDKFGNPINTQNPQYNDWVKYNILNPYGQGMDLNTSLAYTGQQFGQGNTGMGIAGAGLSALKGVRSFLSGYGSGRGQQNVERQMRDRLYNNDESLYQQGGAIIDNTYVPKPKVYKEAPKRELSTEELSALAHQKRGQGSLDWIGNQGYVKSHDPILNKTGTLTPNQIAELQKYMDNSSLLEVLYQGLPNAGLIFGDTYSAAGLPSTSMLKHQQGGMRIAQQGLGEEEELYGQNQSNNYADLIQQAELQGIAEEADKIYNELPNQGQGLFNGEPLANRGAYQPPMSPNGESTFVPTTVEKIDSNSARDVWTEKTGLPWSEAKRLGYTDGTEKDNTKLLQELKDPRFKKENLRTRPFTAPVAQAKELVKAAAKLPNYADFQEAVKGKAKSNIKQGNISNPNKGKDFTDDIADFLGSAAEYLGHPLQTFGEYAKYGELPAKGFSKHSENAYDVAAGLRNPAYWMSKIANAADFAEQKEYKKAAIEAIGALPAAQRIKWVQHIPFLTGLPQGSQAVPRAAGYLGEGAKRLPQASPKALLRQEGGYSEGQEYDLTEEEIHNLLSNGYKLRYE